MNGNCKVIFSEADLPAGYVALAEYKKQGQTVYDRAKRAAEAGEVEAVALMPEGRLLKQPRKFVRRKAMEAALAKREQRAAAARIVGTAIQPPQADPLAGHVNAICAEIGLLALAVADLTEAVNKMAGRQAAPFQLQSDN